MVWIYSIIPLSFLRIRWSVVNKLARFRCCRVWFFSHQRESVHLQRKKRGTGKICIDPFHLSTLSFNPLSSRRTILFRNGQTWTRWEVWARFIELDESPIWWMRLETYQSCCPFYIQWNLKQEAKIQSFLIRWTTVCTNLLEFQCIWIRALNWRLPMRPNTDSHSIWSSSFVIKTFFAFSASFRNTLLNDNILRY